MSQIDFATRMTKCLFCHKSSLYDNKENWLSKIMETQLIATCQTYLPQDFSDMDWDAPLYDGPIFCFWCFDNAIKLSKLNDKINDIKEKIGSLVRQMTIYISCERERQKTILVPEKKNAKTKVATVEPIAEVKLELEDIQLDDFETETETITLENQESNCTSIKVPITVIPFKKPTSSHSRRRKQYLSSAVETVTVSSFSSPTMIKQEPDVDIIDPTIEFNLDWSGEPKQQNVIKRPVAENQVEVSSSNSKKLCTGPEFKCERCSKTFSWFRTLRKHDCNKTTVECDVCGKSFTSSYIADHKLLHKGKCGLRAYQCTICEEPFKLKTEWIAHMESDHFDSMPYKCDICQTGFMFSTHWRIHEKCHETDRKVFKCKLCGQGFKFEQLLNQHFRQKHEKFKCPACDEYCENDAAFRAHLQNHRKSKLYFYDADIIDQES